MKTIYAACLARLGLSTSRAASIHGVRPDTVKSWSSGRNPVPDGAWNDLRWHEIIIAKSGTDMREAWLAAGSPRVTIDATKASTVTLMSAAHFVLTTHGAFAFGTSTERRAECMAQLDALDDSGALNSDA